MYFTEKKIVKRIINKIGTPTFVTNKEILCHKVKVMKKAFGRNVKLFYALKANYNPSIIDVLKEAGIDGVDTVSPFEVMLAKNKGFSNKNIIFTGNNLSTEELREAYNQGVILNLGSISELKRFGKLFSKSDISLRINPEIGDGEFKEVITGGESSKFGISIKNFKDANNLLEKYKLNLIGLQCHIGSGMYNINKFEKAILPLFKIASKFKNLRFIDLGGGFGVRYKPFQSQIKLEDFAKIIDTNLKKFFHKENTNIEIILEPGKFLVAESTCLITKVTAINQSHGITFVGTDTGMNNIIRPVCYSAYHHIINISHPNKEKKLVKVVGNICESSDVFVEQIEISNPKEGDILAILTAGAYCASMSSLYNLRPYAAEVLVDKDDFYIIRERLSFEKTIQTLGFTCLKNR